MYRTAAMSTYSKVWTVERWLWNKPILHQILGQVGRHKLPSSHSTVVARQSVATDWRIVVME